MADILDFRRKSKDDGSGETLTGNARCLGCKYEWFAEAPIGVRELECPSCNCIQGRFIAPVYREGMHWHCACSSDLFYIKVDMIYCAVCAKIHKDFS